MCSNWTLLSAVLTAIFSLLLSTDVAFSANTLKLQVKPQFVFVNENWTVDTSLPDVSLCAEFDGDGALSLFLTNGDPLGYFKLQRINSSCWTLRLEKELDADISVHGTRGQTFSLTFRCSDGRVQAYGTQDIQVVDQNDNSPRVIDTPGSVSVPEDLEVGSSILGITSFDPDTGVGGIVSFTLKDSYQNMFQIQNGSCAESKCTASLFLARALSYDVKNVYTLDVLAFDGAGRINTVNYARFPLVVNVLDVQGNPPRFVSDTQVQHVREDAPPGTSVCQVQAIDGDTGVAEPNPIRYYIMGDAMQQLFVINESTGVVSTRLSMDRENPSVLRANGAFVLSIMAEEAVVDPAAPVQQSVTNITILLDDANDEVPRCNASQYFARVNENSQRLIPITLTSAQDLYVFDHDEAANGEFDVWLEGDGGVFDVSPRVVYNEANIVIRVQNSTALDYERRKEFTFKVWLRQRSGEPLASSCQVNVEIVDVNDNAPRFNQSLFRIAVLENQAPGTDISVIQAFDADTTQFLPIVYSLEGDGVGSFAIDTQGTLRTKEPLDREKIGKYRFMLTAQDENGNGLKSSVPLEISVVDDNDNAPVFSQEVYAAYLVEHSQTFTQLSHGFYVHATDGDMAATPNSNITYWLLPGLGLQNFTLNTYTGRIEVDSHGVDLELMSSDFFNLTVLAKDDGRPRALSSTAQVLIYVNDSNDNAPQFANALYSTSLFENATSDTDVLTVTAQDRDRGLYNHLVAYRIATVQDKFVIDAQTGAIRVAQGATLDRELTHQDRYELTVLAFDQGYPQRTGSCTVNIAVLDINNKSPAFAEKLYYVQVSEDLPLQSGVFNLSALDPDSNARLRYQIVRVEDAETESGLPVNPQNYNYTSAFAVRPVTGEVIVAGVLDREQMETVRLVINVTDTAGEENTPQTGQTTLHVTLVDVNDNAPRFSKPFYTHQVKENSQMGTIVVTVSARDADKNHTLTYSMKAGDTNNTIAIDRTTGELSIAGPIDYEVVKWINFTVLATDNGTPRRTTEVPVFLQVLDENDNSPIFLPNASYVASVPEDSPIDLNVIAVMAQDRDSGRYGSVSYFLLSELGSASPFRINQSSGQISVAGPLDREAKPRHTLTVQAIDDYTGHVSPDSREATAIVDVLLIDANDNAPVFAPSTPTQLVLQENNAPDFRVFQFSASDADSQTSGNGVVRYYLTGGNATVLSGEEEISMFKLDAQSGVLTLTTNLTGKHGIYFLQLEARDLSLTSTLSSNITVIIEVQDINDHPPYIITPGKDSIYTVRENNLTDFMAVAQIEATDPDHGQNAELRYSLKETASNNDWKYFTVDWASGEIFLRQALDYERQQRYDLTARACDLGQPPLCAESEFQVLVEDEDDNCPYFERPGNYTATLSVYENAAIGTTLEAFLAAVDKDTLPQNVHTCYNIANSGSISQTQSFQLTGRNSTTLRTVVDLDREQQASHQLVIQATACMTNPICSTSHEPQDKNGAEIPYNAADNTLLLVHVNVLDVNDNAPVFQQKLFRGGVQYDTRIGTRVAKVRAADADSLDDATLKYYLSGPISVQFQSGKLTTERAPFLLNETSGDVITNIVFQPSWKGSFEFHVLVNDSVGHTDNARVSIKLLSFDQQVELVFESPANRVWEEAAEIIDLLSQATQSNATIDDVQAIEDDDKKRISAVQSKVLVHFLGPVDEILPVDAALKALDVPESSVQRRAKQLLITTHRLKYAGQNPQPVLTAQADYTLYFAFAGIIAGLLLILVVLIALWCTQNARYKRKLKAATTLAFTSSDPCVPASVDVPGTNLHAGSNPVWSGIYGADNYGLDYDARSSGSVNSLDENAVEVQRHPNAGQPPASSNHHKPVVAAIANGFLSTQSRHRHSVANNSPPPTYEQAHSNGHASVVGGTLQRSVPSHAQNGFTISSVQKRANGHGTATPTERGIAEASRYIVDRMSPQPNYPSGLLANLESTEL